MMIKAASTSIRDRTNEFQKIAERLKKSSSSTQNGPSNTASSSSSASRSAEDWRLMVALQSPVGVQQKGVKSWVRDKLDVAEACKISKMDRSAPIYTKGD